MELEDIDVNSFNLKTIQFNLENSDKSLTLGKQIFFAKKVIDNFNY